jgi:hypothetical protein
MKAFATVTKRNGHIDEVLTEGDTIESALEHLDVLLALLDVRIDTEDFTAPVFIIDTRNGEAKEIII